MDRGEQSSFVSLRVAHPTLHTLPPSDRRPGRCCRIKEVIDPDSYRALLNMYVYLPKELAQNCEPFEATVLGLFSMMHRLMIVHSPETDLRMNLERPLLTFRCDRIINLLDLLQCGHFELKNQSSRAALSFAFGFLFGWGSHFFPSFQSKSLKNEWLNFL